MLLLSCQTSSAIETLIEEGSKTPPKKVHVVVKNAPFSVRIAFPESLKGNPALSRHWNFFTVSLSARLAYDCPEMKSVDYVRVNPVEIRPRVSTSGDAVNLEVRVKVLSSQLEDMSFRILFQAVDNVTKEEIHGLSVISMPIKVVSKFDQIKRNKDAIITAVKTQPSSPSSPVSGSSSPPSPVQRSRKRLRTSSVSSGSPAEEEVVPTAQVTSEKPPCKRRRTAAPDMHGTHLTPDASPNEAVAVQSRLGEVQRQQNQQTRMLETLLQLCSRPPLTPHLDSDTGGGQIPHVLSFEMLLLETLNRYQELTLEDRMSRIRTAMFSLSSRQAEALNSLFEDIRSENSSSFSSPGEFVEPEEFLYVNSEWQPTNVSPIM